MARLNDFITKTDQSVLHAYVVACRSFGLGICILCLGTHIHPDLQNNLTATNASHSQVGIILP